MNFVEKFVYFYFLQVLIGFFEIVIWLYNVGIEFEDLLGINFDFSFR